MAPKAATGGIKGFYKQKKSGGGGGVSKGKPGPKPKKSAGSLGSDVAQPPALVTHGGSLDLKEDYNEQEEEILNQFDMNMAYGPCIGMSRLARWERANELGMNPPKDVEELLRSGKVGLECLWDGRI